MLRSSFYVLLGCILLTSTPLLVSAIGGPAYISTTKRDGYFPLFTGKSTPIYADPKDFKGVIRALFDLKSDLGKVTGKEPNVSFGHIPKQKKVIIIGTLGKSSILDRLVETKKLDVRSIKGKWEAFLIQTLNNPMPGVDQALVIAGSDKRGTIFGIYDVSEKIGVSPWYWWADVATERKTALYVKPGSYTQSPSIKYRGIFINDEAPTLTGWVKEKFGTVPTANNPLIRKGVPNYNHLFYSRVFELLLRLKANYLWPAMWENAFNEDDPENPRLADEYGIVMGTSHQEPMVRSQQEWDRRYYKTLGHWNFQKYPDIMQSFWREGIQRNKDYESIVTMGLRGANDSEIEGDLKSNINMVENIVKLQQTILKEETKKDLSEIPQSWCLYKEIMDYYNEGMQVPEEITLLWSDDNWGNIRRLPNAEERKRKGGAGVYYHFDYHGDPRSYEWINTNPIAKIWDQMSMAKQYGADRIWVVNVGHLRGYELPTEYFMSLGWNTETWTHNNINEFTRLWITREFGSKYANEIADIVAKYTKFNGRRKPESLRPETYSLINYREAERIVSEFKEITQKAEFIYSMLPVEKRDAFYHIVLFPTKASAQVNEMYVTAAKNALFAKQKRASTNEMAKQVKDLFKADSLLMLHYNEVFAGGKWKHTMNQPHIGYNSWSPPKSNNLNAIKLENFEAAESADMGVAVEGSEVSWPGSEQKAGLPEFNTFNSESHYLEIFNRGMEKFDYTITANVPWLNIADRNGTIDGQDKRIWIKLVNEKVPAGISEGMIKITGAGKEVIVKVIGRGISKFNASTMRGFIESNGTIAIEAEHFSKNTSSEGRQWLRIEDYGLTLSGMRATSPVDLPRAMPKKNAPCLEYPVHFFSEDTAKITLVTSPQLNVIPGREIRVAVSFNEQDPTYITVVPEKFKVHYTNRDWAETVVNQARRVKANLKIPGKGNQTLKVWMVDPGVLLQKIIIDTGGLQKSYLGPQESYFSNPGRGQ